MSKMTSIVALMAAAGMAVAQPFTFVDEGDFSIGLSNGSESLNVISGTTVTPATGFAPIVPVGTTTSGAGITAKASLVRGSAALMSPVTYNAVIDTASFYPAAGFFTPFQLAPEMIVDMGTTLGSGATATTITMGVGHLGDGISFASVWPTVDGITILSSSVELFFAPNNAGVESSILINNVAFDNGDYSVGMSYDWSPGTDVGMEGFAGARWKFSVAVTPTPSTAALLGLGGMVATRRRRG